MGCSRPFLNPWSEVRGPSAGPPRSIGEYWAGCLDGAASLPPDGPGFQMMRLRRGRFYGHPRLVRFIQELGGRLANRGLGPLLVGDLGLPRGGPTLSGHVSHQSGLDADIWFWHPAEAEGRSLTLDERETLSAPSVILADGSGVHPGLWTADMAEALRLAAEFDEVDRIFVHPAVKRELCAAVTGPDPWLSKIRPWHGHDDHFHVRLRCPDQDGLCQCQNPPAPEDGCGAELAEWFKPRPPEKPAAKGKKPALPPLPPACAEVLAGGLTSDFASK